jgi:hypothetical protein
MGGSLVSQRLVGRVFCGPPSPASAGVLSALPPPNLRLTIACADDPFVTSGEGLEVTLDREHDPLAGRTGYLTAPELTRRGGVVVVTVPVDVGYVGAELTASYNIEPTDFNGSTLLLSAGILWQPAAACSREPFLRAVGQEHAPPAFE